MTFYDKVKRYVHGEEILQDWIVSGIPVSKELAQKRANVCLKCSMNQPGPVPVELIATAVKKLMAFKSHLQLQVQGERRLLACRACDCPINTKIWIPLDQLMVGETPESLQLFDPKCWMRNEQS